MWYYLFNLLTIVINIIIKPVLHTQAVHGEDTKKTQETALQYGVQIPSGDGEIKGQI